MLIDDNADIKISAFAFEKLWHTTSTHGQNADNDNEAVLKIRRGMRDEGAADRWLLICQDNHLSGEWRHIIRRLFY